MSRPSKRHLGKVSPEQGQHFKAPIYGDELPDDARNPIFSLELLSKDYCISKCTKEEKAAVLDRLREMSLLTWGQLRQAPRHGQGYEKIARSSIKAPIPKAVTEDVSSFIAFRCIGKAPMVGLRIRHVYYIIWIDRAFALYKHS